MKVFINKDITQTYINPLKNNGLSIGLIPTMGALHDGHLSLIKQAQKNNDLVIVSIFVNPTQFNNVKDLEKYPRTLERDLEKLRNINCDAVFTPRVSDIYDENEQVEVFNFDGLDIEMEGRFRNNHFNGVGTIIKKLFTVLKPDRAYFGEKDFQQLQIIRKLISITQHTTTIIGCSIYREKDGLAMSSRNARLTKEHRAASPFIYKTLQEAKNLVSTSVPLEIEKFVIEQFKNHPLLNLEYFSIANENNLKAARDFNTKEKKRGFIAVFAGEIRLIDNIAFY